MVCTKSRYLTNTLESEKRVVKPEITLQSIVYCFFVVVIHLLSRARDEYAVNTFAGTLIFCVQRILFCSVYGFVFLSALKTFLNPKMKLSCIKYSTRRIQKTAVPYIFAAAVYWLILERPVFSIQSVKELTGCILSGEICSHFYFVIVIVQFYLLIPLFKRAAEAKHAAMVILTAALLNILTAVFLCRVKFYNRLISRYLLCYVMGCFAGKNYGKFLKYMQKPRLFTVFMFFFASAAELLVSYNAELGKVSYVLQQVVTMLCMPWAVLFRFNAASSFALRFKIAESRLVRDIGASTYRIYLWHPLIIMLAERAIAKMQIGGFLPRFCTLCILTFSGILLICLAEHIVKLCKKT